MGVRTQKRNFTLSGYWTRRIRLKRYQIRRQAEKNRKREMSGGDPRHRETLCRNGLPKRTRKKGDVWGAKKVERKKEITSCSDRYV